MNQHQRYIQSTREELRSALSPLSRIASPNEVALIEEMISRLIDAKINLAFSNMPIQIRAGY